MNDSSPTSQAVDPINGSTAKQSMPLLRMEHVHLVSNSPMRATCWYVDMLGGKVSRITKVNGANQFYIAFEGGMTVNIRGKITAEKRSASPELESGIDHFGFILTEDYDKFCDRLKSGGVKFVTEPFDFHFGFILSEDYDKFCDHLKSRGVKFIKEPFDFQGRARVAYIEGPDNVTIELAYYYEK